MKDPVNIDPIYQEVINELDENGLNNIPVAMRTKAFACIAENMLQMEDYKKIVKSNDPSRLLEVVKDRFEQLEAMRQSHIDDNYELLRQIKASDLEPRIVKVLEEGRVDQETYYAVGYELRAQNIDTNEWNKDLLQTIVRSNKVREAEIENGILLEYSRNY